MNRDQREEFIDDQARAFKQALDNYTIERKKIRFKQRIIYPIITFFAIVVWFEGCVMYPLGSEDREIKREMKRRGMESSSLINEKKLS